MIAVPFPLVLAAVIAALLGVVVYCVGRIEEADEPLIEPLQYAVTRGQLTYDEARALQSQGCHLLDVIRGGQRLVIPKASPITTADIQTVLPAMLATLGPDLAYQLHDAALALVIGSDETGLAVGGAA